MKNYFWMSDRYKLIAVLLCFFMAACSKSGSDVMHITRDQKPVADIPSKGNDTSVIVNSATGATTNIIYKISDPISYNNAHNLVISGLRITNASGICIRLSNCSNITIKNCKLGPSVSSGIQLSNCSGITVDSCYISDVSTGLYALQSSTVKFRYNNVTNVQGPYPQGQMLQFDNVKGAGNQVLNNSCENVSGLSNPEDVISIYQSNGTASDPIMIVGNRIRGGGPSRSGSGIVLGDKGGSYIVAKNNILVNTGNCGIGIAGGNNIQVTDNMIFGAQTAVSNVGIYIWNQSGGGCSVNTISGNQVNWTNAAGQQNSNWNGGNCGTVVGWNTNTWGAPINSSILPVQL